MWSTIANLKENLNKIALDVHDKDEEEDEVSKESSVSDSWNSNGFVRSNGVDRVLLSEDLIVRLNKENGSIKQNLEATNAALSASRIEGSRASTSGTSSIKELADSVDGKNRSSKAVQYSPEIRKLKLELKQERDQLTNVQLKFREEQELNKSFRVELKKLKSERENTSKETSKIQNELNEKASEIKHLQFELTRRQNEESVEAFDSLKRLIKTLENENTNLKMEKSEIEAALEKSRKSFTEKMLSDAFHIQKKDLSSISDMPDHSDNFPGKEEMERSLQKLSNDLKETRRDRDKALKELSRLKQHLLEKASEEAEKMDEDSIIIEELRDSNNYLRAQISHLERTLTQTIASQEELKMANNMETLKSREIIDDLNKKLTNCLSTIDSKNIELSNLQTALGQYYAEIEAKEHLEEELAWARKETTKLSQLLKDAYQRADISKAENEETLAKLSQSEKAQTEWKGRVSRLEEDNARLRRAVEQSMTRLNRMSVDSDHLVDRRIVIKLLVTYFQRNHSREVLDLMVRMLGFSDEDKQRIGIAQQGASNSVIRGVFRLPGRLVGGILGGSSTEAAANAGSHNQSFADLWVDFLLKETEEREKRESAGNPGTSTENLHDKSPDTISTTPPLPNQRFGSVPLPPLPNQRSASAFPINSTNQNLSLLPPSYLQRPENFGSDFSTVPLTPSDAKTSGSNLIPRY
ncbi:golgin candidate 3 isoform X2 [Medicago truncatula]|uniref:Coiled-coil vesicle tethering protein, putative n=1 Tax=Medicago truncatula TaxID=3880 RepID=A0A072TMQ8_MEDTR|nr:golgin candidate 3 isoform X2 [Medicago truncatula]KEH18779.1 coiled-coil vesicle tethering protein, putative [Medicago truncatula]